MQRFEESISSTPKQAQQSPQIQPQASPNIASQPIKTSSQDIRQRRIDKLATESNSEAANNPTNPTSTNSKLSSSSSSSSSPSPNNQSKENVNLNSSETLHTSGERSLPKSNTKLEQTKQPELTPEQIKNQQAIQTHFLLCKVFNVTLDPKSAISENSHLIDAIVGEISKERPNEPPLLTSAHIDSIVIDISLKYTSNMEFSKYVIKCFNRILTFKAQKVTKYCP